MEVGSSASRPKTESVAYWKKMFDSKARDCTKLIEGTRTLQRMVKALQQENERLEKKLKSYENEKKAAPNEQKETHQNEEQIQGKESSKDAKKIIKNKKIDATEAAKVDTVDKDGKLPYVCVVGATETGLHFCNLLKQSGNYNIHLVDNNPDSIRNAFDAMKKKEKQYASNKNNNVIKYSPSWDQAAKYRPKFVIDTIDEPLALKKQVLTEVYESLLTGAKQDASVSGADSLNHEPASDRKDADVSVESGGKCVVPLNCVIASVCWMWSVTELAAVVPREHRSCVVGVNLESSVNERCRHVEIRPAWQTSPKTVDTMKKFVTSLKVLPKRGDTGNDELGRMSFVTVTDSPGLVKLRLLAMYVNEAFALLEGKVCSAKEIDAIMSEAMQLPDAKGGAQLGPLALADCVGLDRILGVLNVLKENLGGDRYCPNYMLKQYVRSGRLGRKTNVGVYVYQ